MASSVEKEEEALSVELPAPSGWTKKYVQKKGGTPKKSGIIFISPTGEEIGHKRQLDKYLKAHPGGPASSEFDWGKTGETRRRSTRISEKSKTAPPQKSEPPKKRSRKSTDDKETENSAEGNEGEEEIKDEAEKITENEAESDQDVVNENRDDGEKETDTKIEVATQEPKIEGNLVTMSNDAEQTKKDTETETVGANEDEEKAETLEKGEITGPEPKGAAGNGSSNCEVKP
jgi:hypothetical protein